MMDDRAGGVAYHDRVWFRLVRVATAAPEQVAELSLEEPSLADVPKFAEETVFQEGKVVALPGDDRVLVFDGQENHDLDVGGVRQRPPTSPDLPLVSYPRGDDDE